MEIKTATRKESEDGEIVKTAEMLYIKKEFFWATLLTSCIVAFVIGQIARISILDVTHRDPLTTYDESSNEMHRMNSEIGLLNDLSAEKTMNLPDPVIKQGKTIPQTTYTSKHFNTASATTYSRWIVSDTDGQQECLNSAGVLECTSNPATDLVNETILVGQEIESEEHLPSGQHLLLDLENIDADFLNSEERLATAMLALVGQCGLTLMSYHCHKLKPNGVSCAGVLLESHVSFHTWPSRGVISIDLFTCGPSSLLHAVPVVEQLFAVASSKATKKEQQPKMVWAHKYRGFSDHDDSFEMTDMFQFPVGQMSDYKKEVLSVSTPYQRMDVYDVLRPGVQSLESYMNSLSNDGSYEAQHPDFFAPDRVLFLDGILQSRRSGDAAYHESLVHPAMFAHKNPKRVAIIGGGEGATLREVLKHNTVETVVMIDIDEQMVTLSREYLPFWSDCSMLLGGSKSCFDDPRVETYYEDAFKWFIDRFSVSNTRGESSEQPFDVIIMDALDPQVQKEFAETLYDAGAAIFSQGLDSKGILIAQVGEADTIHSPSGQFSIDKNRLHFIEMLASMGFKVVRDYEESHSGFMFPWKFVVAFKEARGSVEWLSSSAEVELKIQKRGMVASGMVSPFLYFDGATMETYKYPSKGSEISFCHSYPSSHECLRGHGFDPERPDLPLSSLEVNGVNSPTETRVFTTTDIHQDTYIGLEKVVPNIFLDVKSVVLAMRLASVISFFWKELLDNLMQSAGYCEFDHGAAGVTIHRMPLCFVNCHINDANNIGSEPIPELLIDGSVPLVDKCKAEFQAFDDIYNPAKARQIQGYFRATPVREIQKGEEFTAKCCKQNLFVMVD
ncbi:spermine/spermidine synthase domain containing protein [Nitzschia inconspicua]|uniref:Spermine/spermidine synthase domain containing protein n=1 Tax=Nitzschia inconspicua TaxID=303405 RepID=A0A9K3KVF0_9STRA|nr:spermine/spermidine synthase domain containing protein [Nitzschia inconspicua]